MSTTALTTNTADAALTAAKDNWRRNVEAELKGASFEKKLLTRTFEGVTLQPLYTRADIASRPEHAAMLSRPAGSTPYLRGTRASGYAAKSWEVAQEIAAPDAREFNRRLREDLMGGQDAAVIVSRSTARPDGIDIADTTSLGVALDGIELAVLPVHIDAGVDATALGAALLKLGSEKLESTEELAGSVTADPLANWAAGGGLAASYSDALDALASWTKNAASAAPSLRTIGVDGRLWAETGGTAVHELACALSATVEYLRELQVRGVPLAVSVPRLVVTLSSGPQFLMETAKFRAWRPLLARVVAAMGGDATLSGWATVHASTTRWNKTRLDPHVNMLRVTTEAFAAVLGGVDALHIAPYDAIAGDKASGDGVSRRIARNVHALLAEEFGATAPADPAGGSWCIESLTDELARKAWAQFQTFEKLGGFSAALRAGEPQKLVAAAAAEKAQAFGARRSGLVGTNLFPNLKETSLPPAPANAPGQPVTKEIIAAVTPFRAAAGFEALRDASAAYAARTGARPRVFVAKMGPVLQHKARADFAAGFFAPGGFELLAKKSFATAAEAAEAAAASGAPIAVLCSTDDTYPELVPGFAAALRASRPEMTLVLAGLPADAAVRDAFSAAGIDLFIHLRAPVEETLASLLKKIGAL